MFSQKCCCLGGLASLVVSGKESVCNAGDTYLIPGLGRSPGEGNGNELQCSCLENPMDREAWWATVQWVTKDMTQQLNNSNKQELLNTQKKSEVCQSFSRVQLLLTPQTIACQAPLSMRFSRQEYWRGLTFPSPGNIPDTGIELRSLALQTDSLLSESPGKCFNRDFRNLHFEPFSYFGSRNSKTGKQKQ